MRVATIVGARPQFIKAAVVNRVIRARAASGISISERIVHTGQHFDDNMSEVFFRELDLPAADVNLGLGGATHGAMTGRMLERIEAVLAEETPDWVLVYGDTNSTLAGALAAAKLLIPIAHVEAGLRSFNRRMPEEINRIVADHTADLLFAPTETAVANLTREGIPDKRIARVGDVMLDAMRHYRGTAHERSTILQRLALDDQPFVLATVHRAENTNDVARLEGIMAGLAALANDIPVVLPVHPRTRAALDRASSLRRHTDALRLVDPVGYLDMVRLESAATLIATDSGGVQKEAYFNGVPCITLRDETEWTELVSIGANTLVGADADRIARAGRAALTATVPDAPLYGDGRAGEAIVDRLIADTQSNIDPIRTP